MDYKLFIFVWLIWGLGSEIVLMFYYRWIYRDWNYLKFNNLQKLIQICGGIFSLIQTARFLIKEYKELKEDKK